MCKSFQQYLIIWLATYTVSRDNRIYIQVKSLCPPDDYIAHHKYFSCTDINFNYLNLFHPILFYDKRLYGEWRTVCLCSHSFQYRGTVHCLTHGL